MKKGAQPPFSFFENEMKNEGVGLISRFWLTSAAAALSLAWLLPNHTLPWLSFHSDAWAAGMLLLVSAYVFFQNKFSGPWHWPLIFVALLVCVPLIQFAFGLVVLFGVAWINFAYLLGFLLAMQVGAVWERAAPLECGDYLFLATCFGAMGSVALQLHQFFELEPIGPWTLMSLGTRHFGNMAQPNLLASLLLLGVIGCGWGYSRKLIGPAIAVSIATIYLFGIALTESRTALLNVILLTSIAVVWRNHRPTKRYLLAVFGLVLVYIFFVLALPYVNHLRGSEMPIEYRASLKDVRWTAWAMFLDAAIHRPLFGFGWGQLASAQFLMMDEKIAFGGNFLQSHNLVLDLILWNGFPLGLTIAAAIAWWWCTIIARISTYSQLCSVGFLTVLCTHAMLEYPLQYAYFLLPAGLVVGCLNFSTDLRTVPSVSSWRKVFNGLLLVLAGAALVVTVRDYFRVETSFYGLRFEQKKIDTAIPKTPPNVFVLTQWRDYITFARMDLQANMPLAEIVSARNLVTAIPSAFVMYRLAEMLVFNDQSDEAIIWLKRICQTSPAEQCEIIKSQWLLRSTQDKRIAAVPWPSIPK